MAIEPSLTPIEHTEKIRALLESQEMGPFWVDSHPGYLGLLSERSIYLFWGQFVMKIDKKYSCSASLKSYKHIWHMF